MVKTADGRDRISYSLRVKPDLIDRLKHLSVDEHKAVSELIEEGILKVLESRKKTTHK